MAYFKLNSSGKLIITDSKTSIEDFIPNKKLGTLDIVRFTYNIAETKIKELYQTYQTQREGGKTLINPDDTKILDSSTRSYNVRANILRGEIPRDASIRITKLLSPKPTGVNQQITFSFKDLALWKKNFRAYCSNSITPEQKILILRAKSGQVTDQSQLRKIGPLMTFVSDSRIYLDAENNILSTPEEIKVFGFCYPEFKNRFWKEKIIFTKGELYNTLKEIFKINLQAIIYEAQQQNQKLPFLIFPPGSFISGLNSLESNTVKQLIFYAFDEAKKELNPLVKEHISEFIALGGREFWGTNLFSSNLDQAPPTLVAKADAIDIAKKLWAQHKIKCPIPIMANPEHPVGCGFLSTIQSSSTDEMLARYSGNLHGIVLQERIDFCFRFPYQQGIYFQHFEKSRHRYNGHHRIANNILNVFQDDPTNPQSLISSSYDLRNIDINQVFAMAVKEATKDLKIFDDYQSNQTSADNLLKIMKFARDNQGVSNKEDQLRGVFQGINEDQIKQIKLFSARFQKQMAKYQIFTGNHSAKRLVGARLHRLATNNNILNFFKNNSTLEHSQVSQTLGLQTSFVDKFARQGSGTGRQRQ